MKKTNLFLCTCFTIVFSACAMLDPNDFLALQQVRKSLTDMPGSSFFSTWDFTSDPCSFSGVLCNSKKERVVALNLGDSTAGSTGLQGRLHPSIGKLTELIELSLVPGRVMGSLPHTLSRLTKLKFLAISHNFISGSIPQSLAALPNLKTLDLSYNILTGPVPSVFSKTLIRIDLKRNRLSGSLSSSCLPSSLQYLSLSSNQLTGPVNKLITRLNRINYLDLSQNRFVGPIPGEIFTFPLTSLQLQKNKFSGWVKPLNRVSIPTVDLSYNQLTGHISPMLSSVQNLYLNNNMFSGEVPGSFAERLMDEGMEVLYLQNNFLSGIEINPTAEIPNSSSLCLQYNCMVPPVETPCPVRAGKQRTRPASECINWRRAKKE